VTNLQLPVRIFVIHLN